MSLTAPTAEAMGFPPQNLLNRRFSQFLFAVSFPMSYEPSVRKEVLISSELR